MALVKSILENNGVTTTYHRILYISSAINSSVSITVASYINEQGRNSEKISNDFDTRPYMSVITYETAYKENFTIQEAYSYLKTLPQFEGAIDAL